MAFDAGMIHALVYEINTRAAGTRVDKITQPSRAEVIFTLHSQASSTLRLAVCAGAGTPKLCFTDEPHENPQTPPSLCMALRKYLSGARLVSASQPGFERIAELRFEAHDDMGYVRDLYIIVELMGKSSNLILCDGEKKLITAARFVDISDNAPRKLLPGMIYELPPSQGRADPLAETREGFLASLSDFSGMTADAYLRGKYMGLAPLVTREIAFEASGGSLSSGHTDATVGECDPVKLWFFFSALTERLRKNLYEPCVARDKSGKGIDFSYCPIRQYGSAAVVTPYDGVSEAITSFFRERDAREDAHNRAQDIFTVLANAEARLKKKLVLLGNELADCGKKDTYRLYGDLLTANMYRIGRGDTCVTLENYCEETLPLVKIPLDARLSPSANAQKYYKKYNKMKNGEIFKTGQIEKAQGELKYIDSVVDLLSRAVSEADFAQIREELREAGYMRAAKNEKGGAKKRRVPFQPDRYETSGGMQIYCGRNNLQNDYITFHLAAKNDYWFHVKNHAGSHTLLVTDGREPSDSDFTEAAAIAAYNSKARSGNNIAVDYTLAKNLKKPPDALPGFVIYHVYYTAYVTPDADRIAEMKR